MSHGNHSALVLSEVLFKPLYGLGIEMVGGLIKKQHVRLAQEQAAQGNPPPFTSGQGLHRSLGRRTVQGIHSPFELRIQLPSIAVVYLLGKLALPFYKSGHLLVVHRLAELQIHLLILLQQVNRLLHALLNHFQYGLVLIHLRLLLKVAHTIAGAPYHFAAVGLVQACDDLHKRGLSGAVQTYDADLGPVKECFTYPVHRKNNGFVSHLACKYWLRREDSK